MDRLFRRLGAAALFVFWSGLASAQPASFSEPAAITPGGAKYRLGRNPNKQIAFDAAGTLHATYWIGDSFTNPAGAPSFIIYRSWTPADGWTSEEVVDDSVSGADHVGGREPSLAVAGDGGVWIAWNDHRHGTPAGNWIDNIEIYADFKPAGGSFSATDLRLTTSAAAHQGDNGFAPRIAAHPGGRASVLWYDFHFDGGVSDIFLKTSDASGAFDLGEAMASMRMTDLGDRGGAPPYTVPDLAIAPDGTRLLAWTAEFAGSEGLYYAEAPVGASGVSEELLVPDAAGFFDPPRIAASPAGDVWIAWADQSASPRNVALLRKRPGQSSFDAPILLPATGGAKAAPALAIDASGDLHLAWIDSRAGDHVYYGRFDPAAGSLAEETQVTTSPGDWERPALALDSNGQVALLWEENAGLFEGAAWFASTFGPASVERWEAYE